MRKMLAVLTLLMCVMSLSTPPIAFSQNELRDRVIQKYPPLSGEPVEVTSVQIKGQPVGFDHSFRADGNWIEGLTVEVKNVSSKDIIYVRVTLDFPLNTSSRSVYAVPLEYGSQPIGQKASSPPVTPLKPGDTTTLSARSGTAEHLKRTLQEKGTDEARQINRAKFFVERVFFDENTGWSMGRNLRRDPATNKWTEVSSQINTVPKGVNNKPLFVRTSGSPNARSSAPQINCFRPEFFILECDCGSARAIEIAGQQGSYQFFSRQELNCVTLMTEPVAM